MAFLAAGCRTAPPAATAAASKPPSASGWPMHVTDALGSTVVLSGPPKRVVSLSPNLTEIICFDGGFSQLVGVTEFDKYPPEVASIPKMGGIINPSLEKVVAARPDFVLVARGIDRSLIDRLKAQGVQVFASDPQTLDDVLDLMDQVARMLGRTAEAKPKIAALRAKITKTEADIAQPQVKPKALVVVEVDPLFVAGAGSFVDDLLRRAGFTNAAAGAKPWAQWSAERLLAANPDVVMVVTKHGEISHGLDRNLVARLKKRSPWRDLKAVKQGNIFPVTDDYVTIPGPRLALGLDELVKIRSRYLGSAAHTAASPSS